MRLIRFVAVGLACFCLYSTAKAQTSDSVRPFTIKVGALLSPSGTLAFSTSQNVEPNLGVSYEFGNRRVKHPFLFGPYFDYVFAVPKTNYITIYPYPPVESAGTKSIATGYGLGFSGRYLLGNQGHTVIPYIGVGLGIYGVHDGSQYTTIIAGQTIDPNRVSNDERIFGGKIMLGIDTRSRILCEVNHQFFPYGDVPNLSGTEFAIGYRF